MVGEISEGFGNAGSFLLLRYFCYIENSLFGIFDGVQMLKKC